MTTNLELYGRARDLTVELITSLTTDQLTQRCTHCPLWSVQDVVAHHIQYAGEVVNASVPSFMQDALRGTSEDRGDSAGVLRDAWTQAGVDDRRGLSLNGLFAEWSEVSKRLNEETALAAIDLAVHYDDIRETFGYGSHDVDLTVASIASYYPFQQDRLRFTGTGVNLSPTDHPAHFEVVENQRAVRGTVYELLRAMIGRRRREVADRELDWGGIDQESRQQFSVYGWPG